MACTYVSYNTGQTEIQLSMYESKTQTNSTMSLTQTTKRPFKSQNLKTYFQCFRLRHLPRPFFGWFSRCNTRVLLSNSNEYIQSVTNPRKNQ